MGHPCHRKRLRWLEFDKDDDNDGIDDGDNKDRDGEVDTKLDREHTFIWRRRRSATILQLL